ncbi:extracellular solute-binding protein family 3 [sediment metagenome]|uniref:Extracellular solute-binding protein family 3 n=1 Tax=sediment metagenome TaxID=749907 RepID=D9PF25_9ZZZZ
MIGSCFITSCGKKNNDVGNVLLNKVLSEKKIRIGTDFVGTPFAFYQDGKETGFEVELMQNIASDIGVQIEWIKIPFGVENFSKEIESGNVDIIIESISYTSLRNQKFKFSMPYFVSGQAVIVRRHETVPDQFDLSLLKDKKVGIQEGTTGEIFAKNNCSAQLVQFTSSEEQLNALLDGKVDAIISDILSTQTTSWPMWKNIKVVLKNLTHEEYGVIAKKGEEGMINKINETLQKLKDDPVDGAYAKLYRKWFY